MRKIVFYYILFLLIVPGGVLSYLSIFSLQTPNFIPYEYLDYRFSIFLIPLLFMGILNRKVFRFYALLSVFGLLFILYDLILVLIFDRNIHLSHELYLSVSFGLMLVIIFKEYFTGEEKIKLIRGIITFHAIGVLISLIFGLSDVPGRYNAQNLDVGGTGLIFGSFALIFLKNKNISFYYFLCIVMLLLSGSRLMLSLNILFSILILLKSNLRSLIKYSIYAIFIAGTISLFQLNFLIERINSIFIDLNVSEIDTSTSLGGRILSMLAGIQLISEKFGQLPFNSIELVKEMNRLGYPTYPHSYSIILILLSPLTTLFIITILVKSIFKDKNILAIYFLSVFFIYGGITYNFKLVALLGLIYILGSNNFNFHYDSNPKQLNKSAQNIR